MYCDVTGRQISAITRLIKAFLMVWDFMGREFPVKLGVIFITQSYTEIITRDSQRGLCETAIGEQNSQ
jgi:hypothetical protein